MSLLNVRGVRNTKYHVIPYPHGHNSRNSGFSTHFPIILKQKCKKPLTPWDSLHICHIRSEEHTSEIKSLMRSFYPVFCFKKQTKKYNTKNTQTNTKHNST